MTVERTLEELGLTQNEIKVYLALLSTGQTTSGVVVARSGLHRPAVYSALERLVSRGLASFVKKNNRKHFQASEPDRFNDIIEGMRRDVREAVPELKKISNFEKEGEATTLFLGVRGIRSVLDSMLQELKGGGRYDDFGVGGRFREVMGPYWDFWQKSKVELGITSRCIFNENLRGSKLLKDYRGKARFVPKKYHCPSDTMIYNDKIVLFIWNAKPPTAVLIRDSETAKGYFNVFNWMWKNAKR
jgi:predicted transcriptional regulator